jgi:predicted kinase
MGARFILVFFEISKDKLWQRIQQRAVGDKNADSALDITSDILDRYVSGFERPDEDEISVTITG